MNMREHICIGPEVDKRQMLKSAQDVDIPLTRIDQSFGGHVPVGDDDDDDARLHLRSVFPISFDCLNSQVSISKDVAGTVDVVGTVDRTEGNVDVGKSCDLGRDRDKSHRDSSHVVGSDSTTKQRQQQQRLPEEETKQDSAPIRPQSYRASGPGSGDPML